MWHRSLSSPDAGRRSAGGGVPQLWRPLTVPHGADGAAGLAAGGLALLPRGPVAPLGRLRLRGRHRRDRVLPRSSAGRHGELVRPALEEMAEGAQGPLIALHPLGDPELVRHAPRGPEQRQDLMDGRRRLEVVVARLLLLHGNPREPWPAPRRVARRIPSELPRGNGHLLGVHEEGPLVAPPDQAGLLLVPEGEGPPTCSVGADALPATRQGS
mmetsp:Transcript_49653/g.131274  ORF Transcript_49653/g.131274 Transcript_49653/m.131274 type:complete len:213 (-) Transcript_49653:1016-1654(-)